MGKSGPFSVFSKVRYWQKHMIDALICCYKDSESSLGKGVRNLHLKHPPKMVLVTLHSSHLFYSLKCVNHCYILQPLWTEESLSVCVKIKLLNQRFVRPLPAISLELGAGGSGGKSKGGKISIKGLYMWSCWSHLKSWIKGTQQAGNHHCGRQTKRGGCSCQMANRCMWLKFQVKNEETDLQKLKRPGESGKWRTRSGTATHAGPNCTG